MNGERGPGEDRGCILALGFGATVAMWVIGYVSRLPSAWLPGPLLLLLLLGCLGTAGWIAGRRTRGGWRAGAGVGLLSSTLNMLVLGSLLGSSTSGAIRPPALWWIPGTLLAGALLGAAGAAIGSGARRRAVDAHLVGSPDRVPGVVDWTANFSAVGGAATFCLLVIGGVVTSRSAGLAVPDWPTSFGYNMFLYPLSRMSGGIYFEHSHRLFGSLVGLTTLVLAIHLQRADRRRWVRLLAVGALLLVIVQGVMGGMRVTTAEEPAVASGAVAAAVATAPGAATTVPPAALRGVETGRSLALRVAHGVTGQLFFATMVILAAVTSATWKSGRRPLVANSASTDHILTTLLTGAILVQIVLGAIQRHLARGLFIHIAMATVVLVIAFVAGIRASSLDHGQPILKRLGQAVLWIVGIQVLLGIGALAAKGAAGGRLPAPAYKVIVTTAHQATGAVLLGVSVLLTAWSRRLLVAGRE